MELRFKNFEPETHSLLKINELLQISNNENIFKKSVSERAKKVGKVKYIGWKWKFYQRGDNLVAYILLYFLVRGEKHKVKGKEYRYDYMVIIELPYFKNIRTFKKLYDNTPIKFFASDPSFIFFGDAYVLNLYNALYKDRQTLPFVSYAITHPPKKRNPNEIPYFTKHSFKVIFKWLFNEKPSRILDKKFLIKENIRIPAEWTKRIKFKG